MIDIFRYLKCYIGFNKCIKEYKKKWKKQFGAKTYIKIWWKDKIVAVFCEIKNQKWKVAQRIDCLDYEKFIKRMNEMEMRIKKRVGDNIA